VEGLVNISGSLRLLITASMASLQVSCRKSHIFLLHVYLARSLRGTSLEFHQDLWQRKTKVPIAITWLWLRDRKNYVFSRFDRTPVWQSGRRTGTGPSMS